MSVWMYYETDGDSGYYLIKLFDSEEKALAHKKAKKSAYGNVREVSVN